MGVCFCCNFLHRLGYSLGLRHSQDSSLVMVQHHWLRFGRLLQYLLSLAGLCQQRQILLILLFRIVPLLSLMCLLASNLRDQIKLPGTLCRYVTALYYFTKDILFYHCKNCWFYILQILDKEAVEEVRAQREMPDIKPGYIVQLKVV